VKRFEKLERARSPSEPATREPAAKRFAAIESAAPPSASVQLKLHDRYSDVVEEARREREARATEALVRLEEETAARARPHDSNTLLDRIARGAGIGPLRRVGGEARLWLVGAALVALWFAVALTAGGFAAVITLGFTVGALVLRGGR